MLAQDDLKKIQQIAKPLEDKIDDLTLETKAVYEIIKTQSAE